MTAVLVAFALLVPAYKRKLAKLLAGPAQAPPSSPRRPDHVAAQGLEITFNPGTPIENRVLRGLDLTIPTGQFVTVIGTNGAGKSTFLNAVSGDLMVDRGSIRIDGQDVTRQVGLAARRPGGARVPGPDGRHLRGADDRGEHGAGLEARREARLPLLAATAALRELFREKLSILKLGLENRLADRIGLLSGGQRQAVSLLMASLQPSRILLLDEHTAALDPKTAAFVLELTAKIVEASQLTAMMVTHSMRQALDYGTRTVMLHEGRVILDVEGQERTGLDVPDLLHMFEKTRGEKLDDDKLLLAA